MDRPVAIKVAKKEENRSTELLSTCLSEARRVAQLKHPAIVNVLDVVRGDAETWYLVMEFVDGPTLAEIFADGQMSMTELVSILIAVADGVHHAHSQGILHRDLKPGNILLGKDGRPKIVDFGMALHDHEQYYAPLKAAGTPYCMAPEQVRGETHRLDARTDVWSLGVIMYQGLTGKRPFVGKTVPQTYDAIFNDDPRPISQLNSSVPAELARICLKCLSKRMGDRYASAADLAADLKCWLDEASASRTGSVAITQSAPATPDLPHSVPVVPKGLRSFGAEDAGFFLDLLPGPRTRRRTARVCPALEGSDRESRRLAP